MPTKINTPQSFDKFRKVAKGSLFTDIKQSW